MPMPTFLLISDGGQERRVEVIAIIYSRTTTIPYPPSHQSEGNAPKRPTTTMVCQSPIPTDSEDCLYFTLQIILRSRMQ
ncbi:hypothetical protein FOTG_11996 [Fusarium oxysporum f. sp. vasinfectum 25433]|uniref:Uncharacterized protein n=1 Tax=Fusarium oxysporum f. sp. vasinfectum 25433 TaxID=1089449 RepID=X0L247_FUSOX|nr:hypothetical protein FOTG_11996 [Fusarium oxysporum f. sp. vasinfectum 25433]